jgi:hypothetical protein
MLPSIDMSPHLPAVVQPDWLGFRHALLRSAYAVLLVLVMMLPANFVAFALFSTLFHGNATGGVQFAALHHVAGYWLGTAAAALSVEPLVWWAAALWEVLFWASCAAAVTVMVLWSVRAVAGKVSAHARRAHETLEGRTAA